MPLLMFCTVQLHLVGNCLILSANRRVTMEFPSPMEMITSARDCILIIDVSTKNPSPLASNLVSVFRTQPLLIPL